MIMDQMIDLHCHILPALDDGPKDMAASVAMAKTAARDGITHIVATPHVKETVYPMETVEEKRAALQAELSGAGIPVTIHLGGELCHLHHTKTEILKQYAINQTSYVLIEFPHTHLPHTWGNVIFSLMVKGFRPIIAHPERNPSVITDPGLVHQMIEKGARIQLTSASITGYFGRDIQACADYLIRKQQVHVVATDAHSDDTRPIRLSPAFDKVKRQMGQDYAGRLFRDNPWAILNGNEVNE